LKHLNGRENAATSLHDTLEQLNRNILREIGEFPGGSNGIRIFLSISPEIPSACSWGLPNR
jgi:hypothetical protein